MEAALFNSTPYIRPPDAMPPTPIYTYNYESSTLLYDIGTQGGDNRKNRNSENLKIVSLRCRTSF